MVGTTVAVVAIADNQDRVRLACETCGAHTTFKHHEHDSLVKDGRRVECDVCGTWQDPRADLRPAA
jgi:hypothetical protein